MAILNDNGVNVAPRRNYFKEMAADPNAAYARRFVPMLTGGQPKNTSQMMAEKAQQLSTNMRGGNRGNGPVEKAQGTVMPAVNPNSATDGVNALAKMMGYTTPEEEQRLQKASMANRRIMAVADALRQIGNIYNTSRYAPAQKFNSPVMEEQARYEHGKALRDRANQTYLTYQQAKAKQDAEQKRWEATFNYNAAKDAAALAENRRKNDAYVARQGTLADLDKARQAGVMSENEYKALRNKWYPEVQKATVEQKKASAAASRTSANNSTRRTNEYIRRSQNGGGGGRGANPYNYPTMNGYVSLGRSLDANKIGKSGLLDEMARRNYLSDEDRRTLDNNWIDANKKNAVLERAVATWLQNDPSAANYMRDHFGATIYNDPYSDYIMRDDDEDDLDEEDYDDYLVN